jgi:putative ABC transport system ATP-binding protein
MMRAIGLAYRYGPGQAELRFHDFQAEAGQTLLLQGPSGSGKSTLLALLAGLLTPTAGQLQVAGADLGTLSARARDAWRGERIGFVPQRLHLAEGLSVWHNLAMPFVAAGRPVDAARISGLLQRLGLTGLEARRPAALSVGQAQRVALARAVLRQPRWILADEPTAHLDDAAAGAALALLGDVASETGAGLLIATHDRRLAEHLPQARLLRLQPAPGEAPS